MTRPTIRIHDLASNEVTDREMTVEEYKNYEANELQETQRKSEAKAKATAKAALLSKLGITAEEAALLLS